MNAGMLDTFLSLAEFWVLDLCVQPFIKMLPSNCLTFYLVLLGVHLTNKGGGCRSERATQVRMGEPELGSSSSDSGRSWSASQLSSPGGPGSERREIILRVLLFPPPPF